MNPELTVAYSKDDSSCIVSATNEQIPSGDGNTVGDSANTAPATGSPYTPVQWHWFFQKEVEKKLLWKPFSMIDSVALEEMYHLYLEGNIGEGEAIVGTDGGRYDVNVVTRIRSSVYWQEDDAEVRRCSWFFKGSLETRYNPYEEELAEKLEEEYHKAVVTNQWNRRLEFAHGETITLRSPSVMFHFPNLAALDDWNQVTDGQMRPLIVKRGIDGFDIEDGECSEIDHLVFLVHGIGSVCDFRFRSVVEVVDDFRTLSLQLLHTHFSTAVSAQKVNRVEFLPVSWHGTLHGDNTGIDARLQPITLPSIPKLRHFANDTVLDVLFYTSPVYCETIISTVGREMNRIYELFLQRNPTFKGKISLGGHSLGSLILFDLLAHQPLPKNAPELSPESLVDEELPEEEELGDPSLEEVCRVLHLQDYLPVFVKEQLTFKDLLLCTEDDFMGLGMPLGPRKRLMTYLRDLETRRAKLKQNGPTDDTLAHTSTVSYTVGLAGTGQPSISYPLLLFQPAAFYALGSPIAMFVTVRGIDRWGPDFILPSCPKFFNIFHPYDPIAYRIEPLIDVNLAKVAPVTVPHHKGRKRMHLELKETVARMSADLKQKLVDSFRSTWSTVQNLAAFKGHPEPEAENQHEVEVSDLTATAIADVAESTTVGRLNEGRRIDYVLQEAPLESFNEYLFALTSHVCYWESEDTMLMILKEVYASMGIFPNKTITKTATGSDVPDAPVI